MQKLNVLDNHVIMLISTTNLNLTCKICGISKKQQNAVVLTDKFDNNMSNANFCNFFDNIPQILRVKASIYIILVS